MKFVEIRYGTPLYAQSLQLRELYLRQPLGLMLSADDVKGEDTQFHYGLLRDKALVACVVIRLLDAESVRLRQMVVLPELRGSGVGSLLLTEVEKLLGAKGVTQIMLHARKAVVPFYQKSGYLPQGSPFLEVGIPHQAMFKDLVRN